MGPEIFADLDGALEVDPANADLYADLFNGPLDVGETTAKRGPGRPKGSKNRTTADMRRFLLANYRDPLMGVMDITAMTPRQIRKEWACKTKEAMNIWMWAVAKACEYLHQKQPQAVLVAGIQFHEVQVNLGRPPEASAETMFGRGVEMIANSMGYEIDPAHVARDPSHDDG